MEQQTQNDAVPRMAEESAAPNHVEEVRQDRRLTKDEQRQQISDLWERASNFHANMFGTYEKTLEERSAEQERAVFHVISSRQDSVRSAYNDVYDRTDP